MLLSIIYGGVQVLYHLPDQQFHRILKCVEDSIIERVYVIDNSSSENSRQICSMYSKAEYQQHENTGYGDSHNIGIYHLVVNPDI